MYSKLLILICCILICVHSQDIIEEIDTVAVPTPLYQKNVNLQDNIPVAPTRPIAQTVIGSILTGSGGLVVVLDLVLIGLMNSEYGEIPSEDKPMIIIYAIAGGIEFISGVVLLNFAQPKWKEYNEWESKYKKSSMNKFQFNITFNF